MNVPPHQLPPGSMVPPGMSHQINNNQVPPHISVPPPGSNIPSSHQSPVGSMGIPNPNLQKRESVHSSVSGVPHTPIVSQPNTVSNGTQQQQQMTPQQWASAQAGSVAGFQNINGGMMNTNSMTAAAASAMMGRPGVMSQQQMNALRQLQSTYGELQNNIDRQIDDQKMGGNQQQQQNTPQMTMSSMTPNGTHVPMNLDETLDTSLVLPNSADSFKGSSGTSTPIDSTNSNIALQQRKQQQQQQLRFTQPSKPFTQQQSQYLQAAAAHKFQQTLKQQQLLQQQQQHVQLTSQQLHQQQANQNPRHPSIALSQSGQIPSQQHSQAQTPGPAQSPIQMLQTPLQDTQQSLHSDLTAATNDIKKNIANIAIVRIYEFIEKVTVNGGKSKELEHWKNVIEEFFSESASVSLNIKNGIDSRVYNFTYSLVGRVLYSIFQSGVSAFEVAPNAMKANVLPNGSTMIEIPRLSTRHWYGDGSYVSLHGTCKASFNRQLKFEKVEMSFFKTSSGVDFKALDQFFTGLTKNDLQDLGNVKAKFDAFKCLNSFGLQENVLRIMQVSDVMTLVKPLMHFHLNSNSLSPITSLEVFNKSTLKDLMYLDNLNLQYQQHHQRQMAAQQHFQFARQQLNQQQRQKMSMNIQPRHIQIQPNNTGDVSSSDTPTSTTMNNSSGNLTTGNNSASNASAATISASDSSSGTVQQQQQQQQQLKKKENNFNNKLDLNNSTLRKRRKMNGGTGGASSVNGGDSNHSTPTNSASTPTNSSNNAKDKQKDKLNGLNDGVSPRTTDVEK